MSISHQSILDVKRKHLKNLETLGKVLLKGYSSSNFYVQGSWHSVCLVVILMF